MAFVIKKQPVYTWPVKVKLPNGGKWETQQFSATFKKLPPLEVQERLKALADADLGIEERNSQENAFMAEVLLGWEGIKDEDDVPLPFSQDHLDVLLDIAEVRRALFDAYFESALGKRAEAKN